MQKQLVTLQRPLSYIIIFFLFCRGPSLRFIAKVFYSPGAVGVKDQIFIKARAGVKACTLWNFVYRYSEHNSIGGMADIPQGQ